MRSLAPLAPVAALCLAAVLRPGQNPAPAVLQPGHDPAPAGLPIPEGCRDGVVLFCADPSWPSPR